MADGLSDYIPLSKGKGVVVVDIESYDLLSKYRWHLNGSGYAQACVNGKNISMHRLIMNAEKGQEIDHINRVKVDNRRSNLRFVTHSVNMHNIGAKGYHWIQKYKAWQARIAIDYKRLYLGYFNTEQEAAQAYNEAITQLENGEKITLSKNRYVPKGYTWIKARNKWQAQIRINNKMVYLGLFNTEAAAAAAYNEAKAAKIQDLTKLS